MPTTSNFGWTTPADTDLVKDGAAAIRTLGNGIDTSFLDLKGGTTGQVLSKNSNTDLDFIWVAQDDSNAIQNAIVDAKGDLITATANDTPSRLAVGTDGFVLKADSTTATGLKWASSNPSSAWTLVSDGTATSGTTLSLSISGYDRIRLHFAADFVVTSGSLKFRLNNLSASNYNYMADLDGSFTTSTAADGINLDPFSTWNSGSGGFIDFSNCNNSGKPSFVGHWKRLNSSSNAYLNYDGYYNANINVTSLDVICSGTITNFRYRLWGL